MKTNLDDWRSAEQHLVLQKKIEELEKKLEFAIDRLKLIHNRYVQCEDCMARENIARDALEKIK